MRMPKFTCPFNVTSVCTTRCAFFMPASEEGIERCVMASAAGSIEELNYNVSTLADVLQFIVSNMEPVDG